MLNSTTFRSAMETGLESLGEGRIVSCLSPEIAEARDAHQHGEVHRGAAANLMEELAR